MSSLHWSALCKLERRNYGGKWSLSIKYQNLHSFKEALILKCQSILEIRRITHLHGSAHFTIHFTMHCSPSWCLRRFWLRPCFSFYYVILIMGLVRSSAFNAKSHLMEIRKLIFIGFCLERLSKTLKEVLSILWLMAINWWLICIFFKIFEIFS